MDPPPRSDVVVLISANVEWRAIEEIFPSVSMRQSPLGAWFETQLDSLHQRLLFFHGGWGKIAAAASTQYVIEHCRPSLLVNLGTCGGFEGEVARGDIILAERTVVYDIHEQMGDHDEHVSHYASELDLAWLGDETPHQVVRAPIVSADRDLFAADIPRLKQQFAAIVADWESASIAWVARQNSVPLLILRGVSDLVGDAGGEAYDGGMHVFEQNTRTIMQKLVAQLPAWLSRVERPGRATGDELE